MVYVYTEPFFFKQLKTMFAYGSGQANSSSILTSIAEVVVSVLAAVLLVRFIVIAAQSLVWLLLCIALTTNSKPHPY